MGKLSGILVLLFVMIMDVFAQKEIKFLALGDSYTIGESVAEHDRWPVQLSKALRAKGKSIGEPTIIATTGWRTDNLKDAIVKAKLENEYELVTLLIGVNNQYQGRSQTEYAAEFTELLNKAIQFAGNRPGRVAVLSIPDWGATPFANGRDRNEIAKQIDEFNAINKQITLDKAVKYIDITPSSRMAATDASLVAVDGLHPSGKEYQKWSAMLAPVIKAAL